MSTSLGLVTIAEGVETESTLARLLELGCHQGQGLHWAPAMSAEEFPEFVRKCSSMRWMPSKHQRTAAGVRMVGR
jgi:EAL domain-containing protein (putative c-di-GMP-specific phosphodiesterase class I)